CARGSEDFDYR
nr:immunoglobulin heavy chain junction region [Macaca mulatta]